MIYSVYRYDRRAYDYYDAPGPAGTHAEAPPRPMFGIGDSFSPEAATWKLPIGARKVGSGELPRGRIAAGPSASLGDLKLPVISELPGADSPAVQVIVVGAAAYFLIKHFRRRTR